MHWIKSQAQNAVVVKCSQHKNSKIARDNCRVPINLGFLKCNSVISLYVIISFKPEFITKYTDEHRLRLNFPDTNY